jgi:hypothetical protein
MLQPSGWFNINKYNEQTIRVITTLQTFHSIC